MSEEMSALVAYLQNQFIERNYGGQGEWDEEDLLALWHLFLQTLELAEEIIGYVPEYFRNKWSFGETILHFQHIRDGKP